MRTSTLMHFTFAGMLLTTLPCVMAQEEKAPPVPNGGLDDLPEHLMYVYTSVQAGAGTHTLSQMVKTSRVWEPGRTLRVCLFQGNRTVATLLREVAGEWNTSSSTKFDFGPTGSWYNCLAPNLGFFQIRIGFNSRGNWSLVGNHSESIGELLAPSMNFEQFNRQYSDARYDYKLVTAQADPYHKAAIRHEFGHALGLLHEAAHPELNCAAEIRWTGAGNAFDYYSQPPNYWSEEDTKRNLGFAAETDPDYLAGEPDKESIMLYQLPEQILINGAGSKCFGNANYLISEKDRRQVEKLYPTGAQPKAGIDLDLRSANVRALSAPVAAAAFADVQARIQADLESDDAYVRRNARAHLSDLLSKELSAADIKQLLSKVSHGSYRYKLGIATAVAHANGKVQTDAATKSLFAGARNTASDTVLRRALIRAESNLKAE